jgi:hypothetical protein
MKRRLTYKHVGNPVGRQLEARLERLDALADGRDVLLDVLEVELQGRGSSGSATASKGDRDVTRTHRDDAVWHDDDVEIDAADADALEALLSGSVLNNLDPTAAPASTATARDVGRRTLGPVVGVPEVRLVERPKRDEIVVERGKDLELLARVLLEDVFERERVKLEQLLKNESEHTRWRVSDDKRPAIRHIGDAPRRASACPPTSGTRRRARRRPSLLVTLLRPESSPTANRLARG